MFQTEIVGKFKTHFEFSKLFSKNRNIYEKMWNVLELGRTRMTIWRTRIVCWIPKAINTH